MPTDDEVHVADERRWTRRHVHLPTLGLGVSSSMLGKDCPLVAVGEDGTEYRSREVRNLESVGEYPRDIDTRLLERTLFVVSWNAEENLVGDRSQELGHIVQLGVRILRLVIGHTTTIVDCVLHQVATEDCVHVRRPPDPVDVRLKLLLAVLRVPVVNVVQERNLGLPLESGELDADVRLCLTVRLLAESELPVLRKNLDGIERRSGEECVDVLSELVHLLEKVEPIELGCENLVDLVAESGHEFLAGTGLREELLRRNLLLLGFWPQGRSLLPTEESQVVPLEVGKPNLQLIHRRFCKLLQLILRELRALLEHFFVLSHVKSF